jgi:superfamily II DNA/RNA helicase
VKEEKSLDVYDVLVLNYLSLMECTLWVMYYFQVPSKEGLRALILCPTRELALQTTRELKKLTAGTKFRVRVMSKALASCNDFSKLPCDILVSTPLRLDALLKESKIDLSM